MTIDDLIADVILVTGWDWQTVLEQMNWPRFKTLRSRVEAAKKRAAGVDPATPPPQHLSRDEFKRLIATTGGKIPGVAQR